MKLLGTIFVIADVSFFDDNGVDISLLVFERILKEHSGSTTMAVAVACSSVRSNDLSPGLYNENVLS